jgi:hypothetical protein
MVHLANLLISNACSLKSDSIYANPRAQANSSYRVTVNLVIFDNNGALVDSDRIANPVLAALFISHGYPTTFEESIRDSWAARQRMYGKWRRDHEAEPDSFCSHRSCCERYPGIAYIKPLSPGENHLIPREDAVLPGLLGFPSEVGHRPRLPVWTEVWKIDSNLMQ